MVLFASCGCGVEKPTPVHDTSAKDAVAEFFGGLTKGDAQKAYDTLDAESKQRVSTTQFNTLVQGYSRKVGYKVARVHISSCEQGEETATAHVVLIGHSAGHSRRFEDAITLRRREGRWGVVLPANFGRNSK